MFTKMGSLTVFLLLFVVVSVHVNADERENPRKCNEEYCENFYGKRPCPLIKCAPGSVSLRFPELCRCCNGCYTPVGKSILTFIVFEL